ncbi:SUZ domain-containing protein 1 [Nymphon striatum]|nr:SUZ domain-containing protein 1 [Nymphon striatum]
MAAQDTEDSDLCDNWEESLDNGARVYVSLTECSASPPELQAMVEKFYFSPCIQELVCLAGTPFHWDLYPTLLLKKVIDKNELDRKLANLNVMSENNGYLYDHEKPEKLPTVVTIAQGNGVRTQYVPPEPTVRILRRPGNCESSSTISERLPSKQAKTLKQREAEYAEARRRIMGNQDDSSRDSYQTNIPIQLKQNHQLQVEVIRDPNGPDGSNGFTLNR